MEEQIPLQPRSSTCIPHEKFFSRSQNEMHCELMSDVVQDAHSIKKVSCQMAAAIEEAFIAAQWPSGDFFGSEEELCRRFGVSGHVYTEAVRVMQLRGTAELRRGLSPGLEVRSPDPRIITEMLRRYALLVSTSKDNHDQVGRLLDRLRLRYPAAKQQPQKAILNLLSVLMRAKEQSEMDVAVKDRFRKTRAGQIALGILERHASKSFTQTKRVGTETQLSNEYRADRRITRQAIRLLESYGVIISVPGRGNGIFITRPPSGPICRLLCCYFASQGLSAPAAFDLFEDMSVEIMMLVAQSADLKGIRGVRNKLAKWPSETPMRLGALLVIENLLVDGLKNPLVDLLYRCMQGYLVPIVARDNDLVRSDIALCYADHTRRLLTALASRDIAEVAMAQRNKLACIRELELRDLGNPVQHARH